MITLLPAEYIQWWFIVVADHHKNLQVLLDEKLYTTRVT
jgi:hypothetical protein